MRREFEENGWRIKATAEGIEKYGERMLELQGACGGGAETSVRVGRKEKTRTKKKKREGNSNGACARRSLQYSTESG